LRRRGRLFSPPSRRYFRIFPEILQGFAEKRIGDEQGFIVQKLKRADRRHVGRTVSGRRCEAGGFCALQTVFDFVRRFNRALFRLRIFADAESCVLLRFKRD
jgi:hypothetical protein